MLQPLGHRVLVRPDVQPDQSASGLILPDDRDHVPVSGQIVALGQGGSLVRFKARQRGLVAAINALKDVAAPADLVARVQALADTPDPLREIAVGDYVVFPAEVGHIIDHNGEQFILVNEDDVAALEVA